MIPQSEEELARIVAEADSPLRIVGGGTRAVGRSTGAALSLAGIAGITLYEPGALTLVAKAGTPLAEVEARLAKENQRLAFEPMDHQVLLGTSGEPTIGGMVAANVSGPRRISVGACRDFMLGVRFVDGTGQVIKNGGRVMKNVTGYDLVKLLCGSYGTLGVLTEVALKVMPNVEAQVTLVLQGLDDTRAVAAMAAAMTSPFEVTGAAHDPTSGRTMLRLEGFAASIAYRAQALAGVLAPFGAVTVEDDPAIWAAIRDVAAFADQPGDVWRLSVKPSDAPGLVAQAAAKAVLYDWAGGLVWLLTDGDLRARLGDFKGHATLIRGAAQVPVFQPEPAPIAALAAGLRAKFDPRGILNPGMMG
ncbi:MULTISPECIES: FAD-binding protein [unclassified Yoonia]|uniref:FAD-binding protein n=1 Tax=unclassified Yoonia TaxID=2629118 RepID=UPI002AFEA19A|nr:MULTISPECIES: FAD-binding protein [unclassified Yoonia]